MELLSLPREILEEIFTFLSPTDVLALSHTCKYLNQITQCDQIWISIIQKYGIKFRHNGGLAKIFYKNVLHKYGEFLGLWSIHADCYGGLLHIKYSDGKLYGIEVHPPKDPHICDPLRPKLVFSIDPGYELGVPKIECCINPHQKHLCTLSYEMKSLLPSTPQSNYLIRQCDDDVDSCAHQEISDPTIELERWLSEQSDFVGEHASFTRRQMIYKYMVLRQIDLKTHYSRLVLPKRCDFHVPIQPGLFKGTYSSHGLELVMLTYETDRNKVKAVKVTGDPNVPAGQVTFRADLPFCMHLSKPEQESFSKIELIQATSSEVPWSDLPPSQPFVIPDDCVERYHEVPTFCKARFHGFGQVADEGFQDPSFVEGHWIVFNEDLFGFLWISLQALSMYHRVQEQFID